MATTNAKGQLQELCQLHGYPLPCYETTTVVTAGRTNDPYCSTTVTVYGHRFHSTQQDHARKKDAEQDAALMALSAIGWNVVPPGKKPREPPSSTGEILPFERPQQFQYHFIDCDHQHHRWNTMIRRAAVTSKDIMESISIRGYASMKSNGLLEPRSPTEGVLTIPPGPLRADLADYYLAYDAFSLSRAQRGAEFHIYSKDAAVQNVAIILQQKGYQAECHTD